MIALSQLVGTISAPTVHIVDTNGRYDAVYQQRCESIISDLCAYNFVCMSADAEVGSRVWLGEACVHICMCAGEGFVRMYYLVEHVCTFVCLSADAGVCPCV